MLDSESALKNSYHSHYEVVRVLSWLCMHACMLSRFSHVRLYATLWTAALQAPLFTGFSRQKYWSELLCHPPGALPDPGIRPACPALQADSLSLSHQGRAIELTNM